MQIRIYRQKWKLENKTEKDSKVIKLSINLWNLFLRQRPATENQLDRQRTEQSAVAGARPGEREIRPSVRNGCGG